MTQDLRRALRALRATPIVEPQRLVILAGRRDGGSLGGVASSDAGRQRLIAVCRAGAGDQPAPRRCASAASTKRKDCAPKIGPWPPLGTTHSADEGMARYISSASSTG